MSSLISASGLQFMDLIHYPPIEIEENSMTFVCGESGCGKSTMLKLFNATLSPSAGTILFQGEDIADMNTIELRKKMLLAVQDVYLFPGTIKENFRAYYDSRDERLIDDEALRKALSLACADFPLDTQCSVLSTGERQRVFLAVCISFCPQVLMLDEPTSALDEKTAYKLLTNIKAYSAEHDITVIMICHDKNLVNAFANHVITLEKGGGNE